MESISLAVAYILVTVVLISVTAIALAYKAIREIDAEEKYSNDRYWKHTQDIEKLRSKISAVESMMRDAQIAERIKYAYVAKEDERRNISTSPIFEVDAGDRQNGHA